MICGGEVPVTGGVQTNERQGHGRSHVSKKSRQLSETLCSLVSPPDSQTLECPPPFLWPPRWKLSGLTLLSLPPRELRPWGHECTDWDQNSALLLVG